MKLTAPKCSLDTLFRAFADHTRLRILNMLRGGEVCVCDLVKVIDAPQPKISRHLAYLRRAGLVRARKDGLWSHYTLAPAAGGCHQKLLECLESCFQDIPELAADAKALQRVRQCKGCCS